ncbi:hypothetical protein J1614_010498 [Plenodomus biglobosus]|nr:hypothetical protein J1614_010498 [Plenodomus biglobosus]
MSPPTTSSQPAFHHTDSDGISKEPQIAHSTTNISISPELFEKLYLAPKTPHAADNAGKYANATALGFLG